MLTSLRPAGVKKLRFSEGNNLPRVKLPEWRAGTLPSPYPASRHQGLRGMLAGAAQSCLKTEGISPWLLGGGPPACSGTPSAEESPELPVGLAEAPLHRPTSQSRFLPTLTPYGSSKGFLKNVLHAFSNPGATAGS